MAASWDLPLWLASAQVDSIQLIDCTSLAGDVRPLPAGCRTPDRSFFPGPSGQGRWAERIYYHILNCGLRVPPSAGSGSGRTPSPVGLNRVYVHCRDSLDYETWWTNLRAGRVFVTNGPLLRPHVEGQPPGYVFYLEKGEAIELEVGLDLATRDRIEYLEIVKNGELESQVRLEKWAETGGRLPPVRFEESGWFLVRAATNNPHVYQLASTGPYYVESEYRPRVSRASVQFFLDWLEKLRQRDERLNPLPVEREAQVEKARAFWQDLYNRATAE
jgi:hypothetical protein